MNGSVLLDTNIVIRLFADDPDVRRRVAQEPSLAIPVAVLGELYYGAQKSTRVDKNLRRINRFLTKAAVLVNDAGTAYEYGLIKNELRVKGRPIPENDLWIAAAARQHDLTLVSDDAHFRHVDGLKLDSC